MSKRFALLASAALLALGQPAAAMPGGQKVVVLAGGNPPPTVALNFLNGTYSENGTSYASFTALPGASFSRSSAGYAANATSTNYVQNSTMQGASVGHFPTGWQIGGITATGITPVVVGVGVENGLQYIDVQYAGTPTGNGSAYIQTASSNTQASATSGQTWTASAYLKISGGSLTNIGPIQEVVNTATSGGTYIANYPTTLTVTPTMQRLSGTVTVSGTSVAYVYNTINVGVTAGQPVNLTLRLYGPMLNDGPTAATYIPTSGSAVTVNDPNGYDLSLQYFPTRTNLLTYSNDMTQASWTGGRFTVTKNAGLAGDGTYTAMLIAGTGVSFATKANPFTATAGVTYTESAYIAPGSGANVALRLDTTYDTAYAGAIFNPSTCALVAYTDATITYTANKVGSLCRVSVTSVLTSGTQNNARVYLVVGNSLGNTPQSTDTAYVSDVQVEANGSPAPTGGYPTAYIATTSAAVSVNDPRITDLGLLVEGASTNLALQSQNFSTTWTQNNVTLSGATAPDGTATASTLTDNATNSQHMLSQSVTYSSGTAYTQSVYAKAGTANYLLLYSSAAANVGAWFNLSNGTVGTRQASNTAATITPLANGWYRCAITYTSTTAGAANANFAMSTSDNVSGYVGSGSTISEWGAQLETGTFPSSYIPTTTASATRAADAAYIGGLPAFNAGGTLLARFIPEMSYSTTYGVASYNNGTSSERADLRLYGLGVYSYGNHAGSTSWSGIGAPGGALTVGASAKAALSWASGSQWITANGGALGHGTGATVPLGNELQIGGLDGGGAAPLNGYVQGVELWNNVKPPSQLPTLH